MVLGKKIFKISSIYFCYVIISPWKRSRPSIWTNLNPLHPRMLCAKFGWNWPSGSRGKDFKFLSKNLSIFPYYLPLEKSGALAWTNLNPLLCQLWLKLAQWFWRNRFLKFVNVFSLFPYCLPFEIGGALHLNKIDFPSPKDALCKVWLNRHCGSGEYDFSNF